MNFDDDLVQHPDEVGSDDLLSDDNLRLPESANPLVRLHAVRAWLERRERDTKIAMGRAALAIQDIQAKVDNSTIRRREHQELSTKITYYQDIFHQGQEQLAAYEEAGELLEDAVNHTTVGERLLVEYYLELDNMILDIRQSLIDELPAEERDTDSEEVHSPRLGALLDVQERVARMGATYEEE